MNNFLFKVLPTTSGAKCTGKVEQLKLIGDVTL